MKKYIIIFVLVFFSTSIYSQQKIGYIDSQSIIELLPDAQDAQKQLDAQISEWKEELSKKESSWKTKYDDYQNRKLTMSNKKRTETEKDLMKLEDEISDFRQKKFGANGELFKLQEDIMKPVNNKIFKAIEVIALEEEYDYIFDRSGDLIFLFTNEKHDLTLQVLKVIKELGNSVESK
jgi:outer membrane protein